MFQTLSMHLLYLVKAYQVIKDTGNNKFCVSFLYSIWKIVNFVTPQSKEINEFENNSVKYCIDMLLGQCTVAAVDVTLCHIKTQHLFDLVLYPAEAPENCLQKTY